VSAYTIVFYKILSVLDDNNYHLSLVIHHGKVIANEK